MADNLGSLGTAFVDIVARQDDLNKQFKSIQGNVRSFAQALGVTLGAAGIVAGFKAIVDAASDFESSFAGIRKTVNATEPEFASLSNQFRKLATEIPLSVNEFNKIGEAAGQLGVKKEDIVDFTKTMAAMGVSTNLSATEAATALARLSNITQLPRQEIGRLGSSIVALGNTVGATESEIVEMSLRIAAAGKQVGLTEAQITGFAGALTAVGVEAQAGGSAISKTFIEIAKQVATGGDHLKTFAEVALPKSNDAVREFSALFKRDAAGAMVKFIEGLNGLESQGKSALSVLDDLGINEIRQTQALLAAAGAGDLLRTSIETSSEAWVKNTALMSEAERRYKTFDSQTQLLKNSLNDLAIDVGTALLPALNSAFKEIRDLTKAAKDGEGPLYSLAAAVIAVTTAMAVAKIAAWTQALLLANPSIIAFAAGLTSSSGAVITLTSALGGLAAALLAAAPPAALLAGLALVAYKVYEIKEAYDKLTDAQENLTLSQAGLHNGTMRAIKDLKSHGIVIDIVGKSEAQLTEEIAKQGKVMTAALQASKAITDQKAKANKEAQQAAAEAAAERARLLKEFEEDAKKARESFKDLLKPADALNTSLGKLTAVFKDRELIAVYSDEIINAAKAQREHGFAVTGITKRLEEMAFGMKRAEDSSKSLRDMLDGFKPVSKDIVFPPLFNETVVNAQVAMGKALLSADELNQGIKQLSDHGETAAGIQILLGDALKQAAENAAKYHFELGAYIKRQTAAEITAASAVDMAAFHAQSAADSLKNTLNLIDHFKLPAIPGLGPKVFDLSPMFHKNAQTAFEGLSNARDGVDDLNKSIKELEAHGMKPAEIQARLADEIKRTAEEAKKYGIALNPVITQMARQVDMAEKSKKEAEQWEKAWSDALGNIVTDFVRGISDVIFSGSSIGDVFKKVGITAGKSFFDAFVLEVTKPIHQLFVGLGAQLGKVLSGSVSKLSINFLKTLGFQSAAQKLSGVLLGGAVSTGGSVAGAAAAGGSGAAGAAAGGAGASGIGSTVAALATNPITIAAAAAIGTVLVAKHFIGRGRRTADSFVQGIHNPFTEQLNAVVADFRSAQKTGSVTLEEAIAARNTSESLFRNYLAQSAQFAQQGKREAGVAEAGMATVAKYYGPGLTGVLDDINATIAKLRKDAETTAAGGGLPGTGLARSASQVFANAANTFASAVEKFDKGSVVQQTITVDAPVEISASFEFSGADLDPLTIRTKVAPEFLALIESGIGGFRERIARELSKAFGELVTVAG